MQYSELEIKDAVSRSFLTPYKYNKIIFPTHFYNKGFSYFSSCKEEVNMYGFKRYCGWHYDYPELIKAFNSVNNENFYNQFKKLEKSYGLPESKVSLLRVNTEPQFDNCFSYVPYDALIFEGYVGPIQRDILIIMLKECAGYKKDAYYDDNGIVEKIFDNLSFYLFKLDDIFSERVDYDNIVNKCYQCHEFGINSWAKKGYLNKVLDLVPN